MLRSLTATIVAVFAGLAAAKFIESAGQALLVADSAPSLGPAYQALLVAAWGAGAFAAAATALLIGRRWAPLGWLAASSVFLAAGVALVTYPLNWVLWPASALTTALGGFLAVRLLRAAYAAPAAKPKGSLFGE